MPFNDKTKEGHFLSTVLNGKQGRIPSPPSHAELLSGDAQRVNYRTDSGEPAQPEAK